MRSTKLFVALCCLVTLTLAGGSRVAKAQDNELGRIATRVQALKKTVNDKYVSEEKLREVGDELQDMLDRTNELARGLAEQNISKQLLAVQEQILPMLTFIRERLPEENSGEKPVVRRAPRGGIGMPQFDSKKLIGRLAMEASKAHYRVSRHLTTSSRDEATTNKLIIEMILAEEALAWEVGWPFTDGEVAKLKAAGDKLTEEVYVSRRDRGIKRINDRVSADYKGVGRTPPPPFVLHHSDDKTVQLDVQKQLKELRGVAGSWDEGTTAFDDQEQLVLLGEKRRKTAEPVVVVTKSPEPTKTEPTPSIDELFPTSPKPKTRVRPVPKPRAKPRLWTDKTGAFRVRAVFLSLIGDKVRLKREDNGEPIELKLSSLSEADREYLESLK
jgi:hypothetical protein